MDPLAAASLLDELRTLPRRIERPRTFMEIGGYAHSENACSNLPAFFFNPGAPHGLGSRFLDALLDSSVESSRDRGFGGGVSGKMCRSRRRVEVTGMEERLWGSSSQ